MNVMNEHAVQLFIQAGGYMKTLERSLTIPSRFSDDILYGMAAMSFEQLMVSFLACHGQNAMHHTPMALYQEAKEYALLPEEAHTTAVILSRFESICSMDGFDYKIPAKEELDCMIWGLMAEPSIQQMHDGDKCAASTV